MNVTDFPPRDAIHQIAANEKRSTLPKRFGDDYEAHRDDPDKRKYATFEPILLGILTLSDHNRQDFLRVYNGTLGFAQIISGLWRKPRSQPFDIRSAIQNSTITNNV
jgi:hypothetical protein